MSGRMYRRDFAARLSRESDSSACDFYQAGKTIAQGLEIQMRKAARRRTVRRKAARLRNQIASLQRIQDIALLNKSFVEDKFQIPRFQIPNSSYRRL